MFEVGDVLQIQNLVEQQGYHDDFDSWNRIKKVLEAVPTAHNSAMDAMRAILAVINGRGDSVTKVLKCKDILAQHQ